MSNRYIGIKKLMDGRLHYQHHWHDREQSGIRGEDLSVRRTSSKEFGIGALQKMSTIRIKKSKSGDGLGSVSSGTSKHKRSASNQGLTSGHTSPMGASISAIDNKLIDPSIPMSPLEVDIDSVASPNEATDCSVKFER